MPYPTFWFSNSGLTLNILLEKICCYKESSSTIDYEWDTSDTFNYSIERVQPNINNSM